MSNDTHKQHARIPLSEPALGGNEWLYIKECLDTGWVSTAGSFVNRFEENIAAYTGATHAVAVVNGTAALHLALLVVDVRPDDFVLVPTLTFVAPVNTITYVGAHPVFMDCDSETLGMDVARTRCFLENDCTRRNDGCTYHTESGRRVAAMIPVHIFGHPCDMQSFSDLGKQYNIRIIEDATESLGSTYRDRRTGILGDIGCLSFNGNKIITTGGGGMIVTDNAAWAERARHLSTQAKSDGFTSDHDAIGYNYRLTNIQAAMGIAQMEVLDSYIAIKRKHAALYRDALEGIDAVRFMWEQSWARSNFWFYTIVVPADAKDGLLASFAAQDIQARPIWKLIHTLPMYRAYQDGDFPSAKIVHSTHINLPCSVTLRKEDITRVVACIRTYFNT